MEIEFSARQRTIVLQDLQDRAGPDLSALAADYDRWGLAPEAEALREQARHACVADIIAKALRAGRDAG